MGRVLIVPKDPSVSQRLLQALPMVVLEDEMTVGFVSEFSGDPIGVFRGYDLYFMMGHCLCADHFPVYIAQIQSLMDGDVEALLFVGFTDLSRYPSLVEEQDGGAQTRYHWVQSAEQFLALIPSLPGWDTLDAAGKERLEAVFSPPPPPAQRVAGGGGLFINVNLLGLDQATRARPGERTIPLDRTWEDKLRFDSVTKVTESNPNMTCLCCKEARKTIMCVPCQHVCMCDGCAKLYFECHCESPEHRKCLVCREVVTDIWRPIY